MYKSRRVLFSLFVNIPLTTPRINFRISECHHRFSIDLIIIFSAKNGKLFLDHTDPLRAKSVIADSLEFLPFSPPFNTVLQDGDPINSVIVFENCSLLYLCCSINIQTMKSLILLSYIIHDLYTLSMISCWLCYHIPLNDIMLMIMLSHPHYSQSAFTPCNLRLQPSW